MASASSMAVAVSAPNGLPPESVIFGSTATMRALQGKLEKVAKANVAVLIQGESGTGKEVIAKLIHRNSPWSKGLFVKVSCPAIPATLMESELFGYEKGAFTGAYGLKAGRVEMAQGGTLFMDEIGELEISLQAKLLQLLQDGQFCRIGAHEDKRVEVRFICATNRNIEQEIANGNFRQDLFYRINVVNVQLPSLRERIQDIPVLIDYFLETFSKQFNRPCKPISSQMVQTLQQHSWPGNVRELENVMKRYVILGGEDAIRSELLSAADEEPTDFQFAEDGSLSLKKVTRQAVRKLERNIILQVLQTHHWNRKKAARALRISYRALLYKLKEAGVPSRKSPAVSTVSVVNEVSKQLQGEFAPGSKAMKSCFGFLVSGLMMLLLAPAGAQDMKHSARASSSNLPVAGTELQAKVESIGKAVQLPLTPEYTIGTEDVLAINVWKEPEISRTVPVRPDGKVSVPLIGEVQAKGLTPKELQSNIQRELQAYLANPEVAVIVQEVRSQKFNILGEVARPGSYPLVKPMTILDALAISGGFRDFAKVTKIFILRTRSDGSRAKIPFNYKDVVHGNRFEQNIELQPYDTIIVP